MYIIELLYNNENNKVLFINNIEELENLGFSKIDINNIIEVEETKLIQLEDIIEKYIRVTKV